MKRCILALLVLVGLVADFLPAASLLAQVQPPRQEQRSRRSQRVKMEEIVVASPSGGIQLRLLPNAERLIFAVTMGGRTVIDPSPIVMKLDGFDLSAGVVLGDVERYQIDETYPWRGVKDKAVNTCNGALIHFTHDLSYVKYTIEARVFDDGVAFRHIIPGEDGAARVPDEYTTFVIPDSSIAWRHDLAVHYESEYERNAANEIQAGDWAGPPITFKLPNGAGYGAITEANLVGYSGMALESDGRRGWIIGLGHRQPLNYAYELRYGRDEAKRLAKPAALQATIVTPWRVVMAGKDLNTLVSSTILPNLCPPPEKEFFPDGLATEWLKPGRAVWRYLDGGDRSLEGMRDFARLAGQLGFEHHVIEGFWSGWSMEERRELIDFSRRQGVGLWFWRHTRELRTPQAREQFFSMCADLGVAGVKLDFLDHEAKEVIDLYEDLCRDAARHKLLINFHGANKPTGRNRTWPNELVREAVKGMEGSRVTQRAALQTTLPFTRYLAGPADYTTMHFGQRRGDSSVAHQIATLVVFSSPLLTVASHPKTIVTHPAVEVIKAIPPVWKETIVLRESEIGELAAFARRSQDGWFLGVMCGPKGKSLDVPLTFLPAGSHRALLVRDDPRSDAAAILEERIFTRDETIHIEMAPGGGFVGWLRQ
jgi:alpha-glucosidase